MDDCDYMERSFLRIWCGTWNVCSNDPPSDISEWLGLEEDSSGASCDIYAVGFQEVNASPVSWAEEFFVYDRWTMLLSKLLAARGYCRLAVRRILGLLIVVFIRVPLLPFLDHVELAYLRTKMTGKGAMVVRFRLFGVHIAFINCHLTPHPENISMRNSEYGRIISDVRLNDPRCRTLLEHQYVLWMGDFNYRVDRLSMADACKMITERRIEELREYDQLTQEKERGYCYVDFHEGLLNFDPTYKFFVGKMQYNTSSERRLPSWCDRVQWRVNTSRQESGEDSVSFRPSLQLLSYRSHPQYCVSDHKPVTAVVRLAVPRMTSFSSPVTFTFPASWSCKKDVTISYQVAATIRTSKWDWIGLYRVGWECTKDYFTYVWADQDAPNSVEARSCQVPLAGRYVPAEPGQFQLVYHSSDIPRGVLGVSQPFLIMPFESGSDCPFVQPVYINQKLVVREKPSVDEN